LASPAASTLRTHCEPFPYVSEIVSPPGRVNTLTGVRYSCPDFRPRCATTPNPGRRAAKGRVTLLVTRLLKRASDSGSGTTTIVARWRSGRKGQVEEFRRDMRDRVVDCHLRLAQVLGELD